MKWNTTQIVEDLKELFVSDKINVSIELEQNPQGERYCRDIYITPIPKSDDDGISIIGFRDDIDLSDVDNPVEDVELVEVQNFYSDSDGGLEKSASKLIRKMYFVVVDYFNEKDVVVVDQLKDYF